MDRLRIGLMLRAVDDVDGQGIYIRKLCDALFEVDRHNEYVAFYCQAKQAGRYLGLPNVREVAVAGRRKLLWDQVQVQALGKTLTPRKNVAVALDAYGRMRRRGAQSGATAPPLVIVGIGIAERLTPLLIGEHTDPANEHTPGFVESGDMPAVYTMAQALVFPSRYESFGIPIVEAMACGCPVVTSTVAACPEIAGDAALLVDPDDAEGLGIAMERVSFDAALIEELRARGVGRAAAFSWMKSALTLLSELQKAAGSRRVPPQ